MLKPVGDSILFVFLDEVSGGWFYDKSPQGLFIPKSAEQNTSQCRWGKVVAIGKDVNELIKPKMNILIEPLKWTTGVEHDGIKVWRTIFDAIIAVDEDSIPA